MSQAIAPRLWRGRDLPCGMDMVSLPLSLPDLALALAVTLFAGFVKGAVGFAMPLIMMGAFSAFLPAEMALAGLVLPTLFSNISQALRQGPHAAAQTARKYWRILAATILFIPISAQVFWAIPQGAFLLLLGLPITAFAALQLAGLPLALPLRHSKRAQWISGIIGGLYGGVSGIWGPPLLVYLLSTKTGKIETVRVQGVVFLIGAVVLLAAHLQTGLLDQPALTFSALLVLPALLGQAMGFALQDRIDQARFRRITQGLLVLTGLNLIRQALI
jgi:uncharacterized protein